MEARSLIIEEKLRTFPVSVVKPSDFKVRDGGAIDPRIVLENPDISLYCLDFENRQALFVETPPGCGLYQAPFLYQAQYDAAIRLIQVPYETLHCLADEVAIDPSRLILIYSVGRCGSTLVSHAYDEVDGVDSISEPDVFTQMRGTWGPAEMADDENVRLLRSCTVLQCVPGQLKGATAWALKFRSMVMDLGDLFYAVFPEAKIVFLYRNIEPWTRSFLRLMKVADPMAQEPLGGMRQLFGRVNPRLQSRETASRLELLVCMWLSVMEQCLEMQRRGIPMFLARYEDLNAEPRNVLMQMFAYSGLSSNAVGNLDAVLEQDSQAGSPLSRSVGESAPDSRLPEYAETMRRLICEYSSELRGDSILPGTYFPESRRSEPAAW